MAIQRNMDPKKCPMPSQDPNVRNKNFDEVALGYTYEMAVSEARRCLNCKNKPCVSACPVAIDIPAFIERVANEDMEGAFRIISRSSSLPAVCGRVCPQELPVIVPYKGAKLVPCASQDDPEVRKQLCWVGCIGCGDCAANCPDGLIHMENGRAVIEPERCEDCNICSYVCPNGVISAREMPEFTYVQVRAMAAQKGGAAK